MLKDEGLMRKDSLLYSVLTEHGKGVARERAAVLERFLKKVPAEKRETPISFANCKSCVDSLVKPHEYDNTPFIDENKLK